MPELDILKPTRNTRLPTKVVAQRYELKQKLGEGGMGLVYRALDTRTNSLVAIKTLRDPSDPDTLAMFRKEWGELAQLAHPNIVGVRDVGEYEEGGNIRPFFVMPLLQGGTLAELIKESSPRLTVENVIAIITQVCRGLQAAHEKELIHRDLKPSNIFVLEDGTAQIIDFGLVQSSGTKSITGLKGTWQYMSPEQTEGKKLGRGSDIFSLGIVAYEALTGKQPFYRRKVQDTADAVRLLNPPPISETNPKVTELVSKAIHVAMAKQLIHRYGSAREFGETLQKAFNNQPIERFDPARIQPKIKRAKAAFQAGDCDFASDLLLDLEAEGNVDPEITLLRAQIEESTKQKRLRQLFDGAQTRLEQDEIPLAMEELAEILKIDPLNPKALAMQKTVEEAHSQNQVSRWLHLAEQHLDRNDFSEAKQALKEVFSLRYDEPEALRLKSEIDVRERDALKARGEKERLYSSALKSSERGEISSAINNLEKILELNKGVPGAAIPERDKVYQAFYHNMVSERDEVDNAYAEGSRHLAEKSFEKSLEVCDRVLNKYPNNAQFLALRLKVEDAKRQDLSAYIVQVGKAVDGEASLDRRVGLLEEASKRFPNEQQFARQLRLAREHRDLVATILAKAKAYEEQEQYAEAIQQWKILATTHPLYVGTEFEISQLEKMRDRQLRDEKKARLVQRIDQALENWSLVEALRLSRDAFIEYPNDQEIAGLERTASQRLENAQQAERMLDEAKVLRTLGKLPEASDLLQKALDVDPRNFKVRSMLVTLLVEQAHSFVEIDPLKAGTIAHAAQALDPEHPSVKRIVSTLADRKRKDQGETSQPRMRSAAAAVESDVQTKLQSFELSELGLRTVYDAGLDRSGKSFSQQTLVEPLKPETPGAPERPVHERPRFEWKRRLLHIRSAAIPPAIDYRKPKLILIGIGIVAAIALSLFLAFRPAQKVLPPPNKLVPVSATIEPPSAELRVNGALRLERTLFLDSTKEYDVSLSNAGFKPFSGKMSGANTNWHLALVPEPLHINIDTTEADGAVFWDGTKIGVLEQGQFNTASIVPDGGVHTLSAANKLGEIFRVSLRTPAGAKPAVDPITTSDAIALSSLGGQGTVYCTNSSKSLISDSDGPQAIGAEGLPVDLAKSDGQLRIGTQKHHEVLPAAVSNAPSFSIWRSTTQEIGTLSISTAAKNPVLFLDNKKRTPDGEGRWQLRLRAGIYKIRLLAPGMRDQEFQLKVPKGAQISRAILMEPVAQLATLVIKRGTPHAKVYLDQNTLLGELDADGSLTYSQIPIGTHDIRFQKDGYQSRTSRQPFKQGDVLELPGDFKLSRSVGYLSVSAAPPGAIIQYSLQGENQWQPVSGPNLPLPPGNYDIAAMAPSFKRAQKSVVIEANKTASLELLLEREIIPPPPPKTLLQDSAGLSLENGWYLSSTNAWVPLRPGTRKCTLTFLSLDQYSGGHHKPRHVEWAVSLASEGERVSYAADGSELIRKAKIAGKAETSTKPIQAGKSTYYRYVLVLEAHRILLKQMDGVVLDELDDQSRDWTQAAVEIKGNAYFKVEP